MNTSDLQPTATVPNPETWSKIAAINRALFAACVSNAKASGDRNNWNELMQWGSVAAWFASGPGWNGELSSPELETELLRAARQLPVPPGKRTVSSKPRWLHVFTEAYATLGHTNLCRRWIQYDSEVTHDVILLAQNGKAPQNLEEVVRQAAGRCLVLDPTTSLWERAAALRQYAWENTDVVVLHTHPDEVMGTVAFGIAGGPPVLFMNHADHVFWTGCAVADLVLEIRQSGQAWTKQHRGVPTSLILPIPLEEKPVKDESTASSLEAHQRLRQSLGLPKQATILLTVGSGAKYEPMPGLNFVATAQEILRADDDTYLVAIGPKEEGIWKAAKEATGGRILPLGYQQDAMIFCQAADFYIEGFPLGSLTALLEAGQAGLMCVRAPLDSPLPFCSDSPSLDALPQPPDLSAYVQAVLQLVRNPAARSAGGRMLRDSIHSQHCADGWRKRLQEIKKHIPAAHQIRPNFQSVPAAEALRDWFLRYSFRKNPAPTGPEIAMRLFIEAWKRTSAKPQIDLKLWQDLARAERGGADGPLEFGAKIKLWRLNRKLSNQGNRQRLLGRADTAVRGDKCRLARRLVYQCLFTSPMCIADAEWQKQFVKSHLGTRLNAKLRGWRQQRQRQLARANT